MNISCPSINRYTYIIYTDDNGGDDVQHTFIDAMFDKLDENENIPSQLIMALKQYLIEEEYESDTIEIDINEYDISGNIYFNIGNKLIIATISDFIQFCKCMHTFVLFSTSFVFVIF